MSAQAQNAKIVAKSNSICKELDKKLVSKKKADAKIKKLEKKVKKMKKKYKKIKAKYEEIVDVDMEKYIDELNYEVIALKQDKERLGEDLEKMEKEKEKWRWDCKTQDLVIEQQQKKLKSMEAKKTSLKTVSCQTLSHKTLNASCQTEVETPGSFQTSACQTKTQQSTTSCQTEVIPQITETRETEVHQTEVFQNLKTTSIQTMVPSQTTSCQTEPFKKEEFPEIKNAICCIETVKNAEEQTAVLPFVEIQKFVHFGSITLLMYKRRPYVNQGNRYLKIALELRAAFIFIFMIVIGLIKFAVNVCRREIFRLRYELSKLQILPPVAQVITKDLEIWGKNDRKSEKIQEIESYSVKKKSAIESRNRYDNLFLHKIIFSFIVGFLIFGIFIGVFFVILFASMYGLIKKKSSSKQEKRKEPQIK